MSNIFLMCGYDTRGLGRRTFDASPHLQEILRKCSEWHGKTALE